MAAGGRSSTLTSLAKVGFARLAEAADDLDELADALGLSVAEIAAHAEHAADPDEALDAMIRIARRDRERVRDAFGSSRGARALWALLGASIGFGDFYLRHPEELAGLADSGRSLPDPAAFRPQMLAAVDAHDGFAADGSEQAWVDLRVAYRRILAQIASYDLCGQDPVAQVREVSEALAEAAAAAIEASLCVARTRISREGPLRLFSHEDVARTRFAVIGMGKCGARELNYVSDVDVIFVADTDDEDLLPTGRAVDIATRLAVHLMRGISGMEVEPPLWEVDANLRPEGKQGALVRTLASHLAYYDRWAQGWEFQALLKARAIAGDAPLGEEYVAQLQERVFTRTAQEDVVESVQRMRERVTDNIPPDEIDQQIKLGPGGIRDIEFTVQLLQLVHGPTDGSIRQRGTLAALDALMAAGYIGRADAASFDRDYRVLRVLEHRVQLRMLRRTHLMPTEESELRVLARASGLATSAGGVRGLWEAVKREVRDIHVRLFYRPLLSAVAALDEDEQRLSPAQAHDRLAAIGFTDPKGALAHISALTTGISRKVAIQRHLMPIMIRWFADGVDPDYGLLAFRRISERLGDTPWFLRMLRDSSAAAQNLTRVLSGSRYIGELMEWIPQSVAWLDDEALLAPREEAVLVQEARAIQNRHSTLGAAMRAVRAIRRREQLRIAMATVLGLLTLDELAQALTGITDVTVQALVRAVYREVVPPEDASLQFAVIGMGRFGGAELGFGSDADVLFVYRAGEVEPERARTLATKIVTTVRSQAEDQRVPLELDANLRPEGRTGPLVRSLDSYRAYYRRWSVSWEAQALLRARPVAGDEELLADFMVLTDEIRYPEQVAENAIREIKRIKARVEAERLPQGAPKDRHLKLGPGGLSDVEWLVQLRQLQYAATVPGLRTTSTLHALNVLVAEGLLPRTAGTRLSEAWRLAGRLRSAHTLLSGRTSDVLPTDRRELDGIGRLLEMPARSATLVEEAWMRAARRGRRAFEKHFYG